MEESDTRKKREIPFEYLDGAVSVNILYAIITFIITIPIIYCTNKYFPFLLGRKKGIL